MYYNICMQEDCRNKCHRYFPPDDKLEGKQDYVQFDQVQLHRLAAQVHSVIIIVNNLNQKQITQHACVVCVCGKSRLGRGVCVCACA